MRNRTGSRFVSLVALGAIFLIFLWRMHLLKSARPTPHSGSARSATAQSADTADTAGRASRDLTWDEQRGGHTLARPASDARVVLRKRGARHFVLAAYPVEP